jgi:hypothetical protein
MVFYFRLIVAGSLFLWTSLLSADWMNLTGAETAQNIAEIYVLDDHVKVKLEVYIGDLEKFEELVPDDWIKESSDKRSSLEKRMQIFTNEGLQFITEEGVKLPAKLELVEARQRVDRQSAFAGMINPMTRQRVGAAPADKRVLYAEIIYPFPKKNNASKPQQLTIIPPLNERGAATTTIGFLAYHKAVPIVDFRYLGQAAKLDLDWQDPWYTKFDNKNLSRHHKYPLMLYLYVEPRQVRLESLLRISDITEMTGFSVDGFNNKNRQLPLADKHKLLQEHIKKYFTDKQTLQIDGKLFKSDSIRVEYLSATLFGLKVIDNPVAIDEASLLVGVSQQFFIDSLPQKIDSHWQYFNPRIDRIPYIATDPVGPLQGLITKDDSEFGWQNFLKKYTEPVIQPVVVETGWNINMPYFGKQKIISQLPDQQQALNIVNGVLDNVRVAFVEKEPDNLSRVLAEVVSTDELAPLNNELAKLFSPKVTGGAVGAVQAFNDLQIVNVRKLDKTDGFSATISGSAGISAQHWGHIDQRQIQFQLLLDLNEVNQQWQIADLTVIDIKEVK